MTPIIGRTLAALAAAGLLALPACGDDGDETSTGEATTEAPATSNPDTGATTTAVGAAFCDAVFATDAALHGADAEGIAAALETLEASAPEELAEAVETMATELGSHGDDDADTEDTDGEDTDGEDTDGEGDEHDHDATEGTETTDDTGMSEQSMSRGAHLKRAQHGPGGDAGMPGDEYMAAYAEVESWVSENCDVTTLEITGTDYAYEGIPDDMAAGGTVIHFTNAGDELHEIEILRLNDDATASLDEILAMDQDDALTQVTDVAGVHVAPGDEGWTTGDLAPGNYVALCFVAKGSTSMADMEDMVHFGDDADTEPHYTLGMIREFTVS